MFMPSIFEDNFVDHFFDDMFAFPTAATCRTQQSTGMKTDVKDLGDHYELEIELPGFAKDNIQAELKDGYLTVSAKKEENKEEKDQAGNYIRRERYNGTCQRSFYVGDAMTQEDIHAAFKDGILALSFPKEKEKPAIEQKKFIAIE